MRITAIDLIKTLQGKGFTAYFAGGCVRDMLLGLHPKDFDIVTNAVPEQIEEIFEHTVPIGKQFGVILVVQNGHHFEVATFRSDSGYSDGRRPDAVIFSSADQDAERRDFTINGMFYDPITEQVFDFVGGKRDLQAKLIRFIGDPDQRIQEDHLRLLRAVRFKNQFNFQYDPSTYNALKTHASLVIHKISPERLRDEFCKMLINSTKPSNSFEELSHLGILEKILPELENLRGCAQPTEYHQEGDVWTHTMAAIDSIPKEASLTTHLATLFHDIGKPETYKVAERIRFDSHATISAELAVKIMRRLQFSNRQIQAVSWCVEHHMMMASFFQMNDGRLMHWFHHTNIRNLLATMKADAAGTTPVDLTFYEKIEHLYKLKTAQHQSIPKPLLNGLEIMNLTGLPKGPQIGKLREILIEHQLDGKILSKEQAIEWLKRETSGSRN